MVFGHNPDFLLNLNSNFPALEGTTSNQVVADNLNTVHTARQVFT